MKLLRFGGVAAVLLCAVSGTAHADITPAEAWQEIQDLYGGFGIEVSGTATPSGGDLIVSDMVAEFASPAGSGEPGPKPLEIPYDITLRDLGDGTVELVMPDAFGSDFLDTLNDIGEVEEFEFSQEGMKIIISGEPGDMALNYAADKVLYALKGIEGENAVQKIDFVMEFSEISGDAKVSEDGLKNYLANFVAASADITMNMREGDRQTFDLDMRYTDLAMVNDIGLPTKTERMEELIEILESGFSINDVTFSHKGMDYAYNVLEGFPLSGDATSLGGTFGFAFTTDGIKLTQTSLATSTNFSGIPGLMPAISAEMAGIEMELLAPLIKSDIPKDYKLALNMRDLSLGEDVWSLFDPGQELPRDPINVALTATGQANMLVDIFEDEQPAPGAAEGEFHSLEISELLVQFGGAELTGEGDFTFDNSDLVSFDGMPRPEGELDVRLTGGNTLIDKLVNIGLLQQEQVMGARMIMAIFTNQVEGEDTMTSKLVVDEAGSVFANGQQIK